MRYKWSGREPLISDPRASTTFTIGDGTYVASNSANAGMGYWIAGNIYHRTPLGGVCETGLRLAVDPVDETSHIASGIWGGVTKIHKLPEAWENLPDYQKQDIGINTLLGIGAGNLPYGQISTLNKLNTRVMTRAEWQAYSRAQRAYANGLTPVTGSARGLERGVPSQAVGDFYQSVASSNSFRLKLGLANRVSKGSAVGVDDILNQLGGNTRFREVSGLGLSRIDPLRNGQFAIRGRVGGHLARETAEHEMLHLAQFLRDPGLAARARTLSWAQRQPFEVVPALIGSPTFVFGSLGGGIAIGSGVWYATSGN